MTTPVTSSSLDVAYWFFNRAEKDGLYLETSKLHHLLFLAQSRYAHSHHEKMLMPCLFLCDEQGFFEPTLKKIFTHGRPSISPVSFHKDVVSFLEQIWQEFGYLSLSQCKTLITHSPLYKTCYRRGTTVVLSWNSLVDKSLEYGTIYTDKSGQPFRRKVLVSQNGPVVVSQWTPRKVKREDISDE